MDWYKKYIEFQSKCLIRTEPEDNSIVERVVEGHRSVLEPLYKKCKPNKTLIIGMGEGQELEALNRAGALPDHVYGGTLIQSDIDLCNIYFNNKFKNISYQDIHKMTYDDNMFDLLVSKHTLEHCPSPLIALCEINRVLNLYGILFLEIPVDNENKVKHLEPVYVKDSHIFNFHHFFCLYPSQVFNLLIKTNFELIEFEKGGGGYRYTCQKIRNLI